MERRCQHLAVSMPELSSGQEEPVVAKPGLHELVIGALLVGGGLPQDGLEALGG